MKIVYKNSIGTERVGGFPAFLSPRQKIPDAADILGTANGYSPQTTHPGQVPNEDDIPMVWVVDSSVLLGEDAANATLTEIRVDVEMWTSVSVGDPTITNVVTRNAQLSVAVLEGVVVG